MTAQTDWQKILSDGRKMIKMQWAIRGIVISGVVLIFIMIKMEESLMSLILNVMVWWLIGITFIGMSVSDSKKIIRRLEHVFLC